MTARNMLQSVLETQRLLVRRFAPEDWTAVAAYATDASVMAYIEEGVLTEEQVRAFIARNMTAEAQAFPVILKADRQLVGHMIFHPWFAPRTYEVGWVIHPACQGHGYAPEAAQALLRYAFAELHAHRVVATCQPENRPSYRVMEKIGMRREGHFRQCIYRGDGVWWDEYFYAILAEEWQQLTGGDGRFSFPAAHSSEP